MSLLHRKRDLAYLAFFLLHIPVMFCVDLAPLYPDAMRPQFIADLRRWYITTYNDQFFVKPPAWFTTYLWIELIYHVPVSVWAIGGLIRDDPKVPLHLLVFGVETMITTATCVADYLSWPSFTNEQKLELCKLYVPYLGLSVFMTVDMWKRLNASIVGKQVNELRKTQ